MSFKKCKDLILGIVMLLFSGFYLIYAQQIKTRPKLTPGYASAKIMPTLLGVLLAILSIVCIYQGIRQMRAKDEDASGKQFLHIGFLLAYSDILSVLPVYMQNPCQPE